MEENHRRTKNSKSNNKRKEENSLPNTLFPLSIMKPLRNFGRKLFHQGVGQVFGIP